MSLERYSRQVLLPVIGEEGQRRIGASFAVVLGCGALGTVASQYLVRAGVGRLRVVDRDVVEESNLQRQSLFDEADARARRPKAEAARDKLRAINSTIEIEGLLADVGRSNVEALIRGATVVVDATDNFPSRFLLNDACVKHAIPWIYGGAVGTHGMSMTVLPGRTPCLRCICDDLPPPELRHTAATAGILGGAPGVVGSFASAEALKVCAGRLAAVSAGLLAFDLWTGDFRRLGLDDATGRDCRCCKRRIFDFLDA